MSFNCANEEDQVNTTSLNSQPSDGILDSANKLNLGAAVNTSAARNFSEAEKRPLAVGELVLNFLAHAEIVIFARANIGTNKMQQNNGAIGVGGRRICSVWACCVPKPIVENNGCSRWGGRRD